MEPGLHIALVGAVFAAAVTIGGEWLPTGRTDIAVDRLLLDHFWVSIPPRLPALVGAKSPGFLLFRLNQHFSTLGATVLLVYLLYRSDTSHTVSAAETFYSIFFQSHSLRDGGISIALRSKGENLSFLFGGHKSAPPSGYAEKEGVLSGFWYKK